MVVTNIWFVTVLCIIGIYSQYMNAYPRSMLRDERFYFDPNTFNPDRFIKIIDNTPQLNPAVLDPRDILFGFGRRWSCCLCFYCKLIRLFDCRICPGRYLAFSLLWTVVASVLATLELKSVGEAIPEMKFISALVG